MYSPGGGEAKSGGGHATPSSSWEVPASLPIRAWSPQMAVSPST